MYRTTILLLLSAVMFASALNAQTPPAARGPQFVQIAPCVLLDTLTQSAKSAAEETLRQVDIQAHRCGRVVPRYATRYSIQIITYSRTAPESPADAATQVRAVDVPATADGLLHFPVPGSFHIAVIIDGYWVAPGTPTLPGISGITSAPELRAQTLAAHTGAPTTQSLVGGTTGTAGDIYLDASAPALPGVSYANVGVAMISRAATPNVFTTIGDDNAHAPARFSIYDTHRDSNGVATTSSELMYVTGDAMLRLPGFALFSGRTSYQETPAIPYNVVHDVSITNPRDAAGGATNRVTFFRSEAEFDTGSPATTKYMAYSRGDAGQSNINFDSQIVLHNGAQYYYRAFSVADPNAAGKDTFWVKAATSGDTITNTRADMYVSGRVGIGTTTPATQLDVSDAVYGGSRLTGTGQQVSVLRGGFNATYYTEVSSYIPAGASGVDSIGWKIRPYYYGAGGRFDAVTVTPTGKVGIGIDPTALLQLAPPAGTVGFSQSANGIFYVDASGVTGGRLTILEDGRIGIGTNSPAAGTRLDVVGSGHFTNNVTVDGVINAKYQDVAEWVPSDGEMTAGTVVVLNRLKTNAVTPSTNAYDTAVAGVVSDQPGVLLGAGGDNKAKIATTGRVKVRVDARTHAIHTGDLLVTSDRPGMAMKSEPLELNGVKLHRPGTLIGKALEPLAGGEGEILVLLSLQ